MGAELIVIFMTWILCKILDAIEWRRISKRNLVWAIKSRRALSTRQALEVIRGFTADLAHAQNPVSKARLIIDFVVSSSPIEDIEDIDE